MSWLKKKYYESISAKDQEVLVKDQDKVSLVLSSYARLDNVRNIVDQYQHYNLLDEIIIWHNGPESLSLKGVSDHVRIIESTDMGLSSRYAAGLLASGNYLLFQDDDLVIPEKELAGLVLELKNNPPRTLCIQGKVPHTDGSYGKAIKPKIGQKTEC